VVEPTKPPPTTVTFFRIPSSPLSHFDLRPPMRSEKLEGITPKPDNVLLKTES